MTVSKHLFSYLKNISLDKAYNETSFQFDLGLYLQKNGFKVEFEVNIASLSIYDPKIRYFKHEIDLVVFIEDQIDSIIELKAPMMKRHYLKPKESKQGFTASIKAWEINMKRISISIFVFISSWYISKSGISSKWPYLRLKEYDFFIIEL